MGIHGVGSSFSYWYDGSTGKISGETGQKDDFIGYFNGNPELAEEADRYEKAVKSDIESMFLAFSSGVQGCNILEEEEGLFQIKGTIVDDGCAKYTINGKHSFERRYGELAYHPSILVEEFSSAERESGAEAQVLGIGFLENPEDGVMYGMAASYAENFTEDDPVIRVKLMTAGEPLEYDIHINQVDPKNATELEMFALCNYLDATGRGTGGKFGTWQTLNYFRHNAGYNGYFEMSNTTDRSQALRQDWLSMVVRMNADYEKAGLEKQTADGRSLLEKLKEHMDRIYVEKVLLNEKPSFSIGAVSYTEEEWNRFMAQVDSLLSNETSQCTYPSESADDQEIHYIVCYTEDGIICKRAGEKDAVWQISYDNSDDYDKVMSFLENFGADENLRFAAHKNFWQDYLSGKIDEKDFVGVYLKYPSEFLAWQEEHQKRTFDENNPDDAFLAWYYQNNPSAVKKKNPYNLDDWLVLAQAFDRWKMREERKYS